MNTFIIEPRDTLVLGDGRGVGESTATRSMEIPWPSSLAGLFRTEAGRDATSGKFAADPADVLAWNVRGPLLCELDTSGEAGEWLAPAPKDAVFFESDAHEVRRRRIAPLENVGGLTDLPDDMQLVGFDGEPERRKPWSEAPRYWRWNHFERWLTAPSDDAAPPDRLGVRGLMRERRTHVSIAPDTRTVKDHVLFELEHVSYRDACNRGLAIGAKFDGPTPQDNVVGLGGERRLSFMRRSTVEFPKPPSDLAAVLAKTRVARLILLTPAIFDQGFRPSILEGATLMAAAVDRPWVVSGWDWAANRPKAARRCAPPGSVYWVRLNEGIDAKQWLDARWLEPISSALQDQRDGFGLVAVGVA